MSVNVKLFDDFDAVAKDAAGALDREVQPRLFDRLDWYRLLQEHCPPSGAPLAARAESEDGGAWLFLTANGSRAASYSNWYTLRFSAPVSGNEINLLKEIAKVLRRRFAVVELSPLAEEDPLPAAFRAAGWAVRVEPATTSWAIATEGMSFEDYWATRPSRLRNTAKRKAKSAGLDIRVHRDFSPEVWADYETVYAESWKGEEGSPAFLRALAEREGAAGTLRLGIAKKDGRPVAAQLWLVENGTATIHKLAYAENARDLSPGTLLSVEMFREALHRDRVRLIDFGTGDDAYKAEWMEKRAPLCRLTAHNLRTPRGLYGFARWRASALVRRARSG